MNKAWDPVDLPQFGLIFSSRHCLHLLNQKRNMNFPLANMSVGGLELYLRAFLYFFEIWISSFLFSDVYSLL